MSRQSRELKKQQERAKKYGCDGRCYWSTGMCPSVEICDETRVGEAIATAIGLITVLAMIAMGVTFAVTNTLEAQKPKAEAQPQAQGINPAALLAAMFANAANQQPRDDTGNESDDDE